MDNWLIDNVFDSKITLKFDLPVKGKIMDNWLINNL